jgi:hypothetical protein
MSVKIHICAEWKATDVSQLSRNFNDVKAQLSLVIFKRQLRRIPRMPCHVRGPPLAQATLTLIGQDCPGNSLANSCFKALTSYRKLIICFMLLRSQCCDWRAFEGLIGWCEKPTRLCIHIVGQTSCLHRHNPICKVLQCIPSREEPVKPEPEMFCTRSYKAGAIYASRHSGWSTFLAVSWKAVVCGLPAQPWVIPTTWLLYHQFSEDFPCFV